MEICCIFFLLASYIYATAMKANDVCRPFHTNVNLLRWRGFGENLRQSLKIQSKQNAFELVKSKGSSRSLTHACHRRSHTYVAHATRGKGLRIQFQRNISQYSQSHNAHRHLFNLIGQLTYLY